MILRRQRNQFTSYTRKISENIFPVFLVRLNLNAHICEPILRSDLNNREHAQIVFSPRVSTLKLECGSKYRRIIYFFTHFDGLRAFAVSD